MDTFKITTKSLGTFMDNFINLKRIKGSKVRFKYHRKQGFTLLFSHPAIVDASVIQVIGSSLLILGSCFGCYRVGSDGLMQLQGDRF